MKRIIALLLSITLCILLVGCGSTPKEHAEMVIKKGNANSFFEEYNKMKQGKEKEKFAADFTKELCIITEKAMEGCRSDKVAKVAESLKSNIKNNDDQQLQKLALLSDLCEEYISLNNRNDKIQKVFKERGLDIYANDNPVVEKRMYIVSRFAKNGYYYYGVTGYTRMPDAGYENNLAIYGSLEPGYFTDGNFVALIKTKVPDLIKEAGLYSIPVMKMETKKTQDLAGFEKNITIYQYVPLDNVSMINEYVRGVKRQKQIHQTVKAIKDGTEIINNTKNKQKNTASDVNSNSGTDNGEWVLGHSTESGDAYWDKKSVKGGPNYSILFTKKYVSKSNGWTMYYDCEMDQAGFVTIKHSKSIDNKGNVRGGNNRKESENAFSSPEKLLYNQVLKHYQKMGK